MIHPTEKDIGRRVIYVTQRMPPERAYLEDHESGVITSFTASYVFVRYNGSTSAATRREDLEWENAKWPATGP